MKTPKRHKHRTYNYNKSNNKEVQKKSIHYVVPHKDKNIIEIQSDEQSNNIIFNPLSDDQIKISQLPETTGIENTDLIPIVDYSETTTKKIQYSNFKKVIDNNYVSINNSQNINAVHNFASGLNSTGPIIISGITGYLNAQEISAQTIATYSGGNLNLQNSTLSLVGGSFNVSSVPLALPSLTINSSGILSANSGNFSSLVVQSLSTTSGNFSSLTINNTGVSLVNHSHTSSNIIDFDTSVSGLLPIIASSGNNRILTSDGTTRGIIAESNLSFNDTTRQLFTNGYMQIYPSYSILDPNPINNKNYGLGLYVETSGLSGSLDPNSPYSIYGVSSNISPRSPNTNHKMYYCGNAAAVYSELPSGITNSGAIYGSIVTAWRNSRGANVGSDWYNDNGTLSQLFGTIINYGHSIGQTGINGPAPTGLTSYTANAYGLCITPQKGYGTINAAYDLFISDTAYNSGIINNHYGIYQIGNRSNYLAGNLSVDNGLSSPTTIYSIGLVSGNTAINYSIDKQIQKLTLNGTTVNFTEGTGWDLIDKSVDVMLEISVLFTTTVSFDPNFVTDWYNPLPTFNSGKYLVLLRSMGSGVVQGHYIGVKSN